MRLVLCAISVFIGGVIFAIPNMTRRELLFAIPVPPGFRDGPVGRPAILIFRAIVTAVTLAGISALLLSPNQFLVTTATYNRDDAALVVERRTGLGYSFNFANRWSWVLLMGLLLIIAANFL